MEIKYKLYPYPVLAFYSDDYIDSSFETSIDSKINGYNIQIDFSTELKNDELANLISHNMAKITYHLECSQTGFRKIIQTADSNSSYLVSNKDVCGKLQICTFLVATQDNPEYTNKNFNQDYRGFKFFIETGCIMAVGKQFNIDVEKEINDLANIPSIFSIIKNTDPLASGMFVEYDRKKIVIKLQEKDYYNFKSISEETNIRPALNSIVVIPALLYVLEEVKMRPANERFEYDSLGWYRAIKKALMKRFSCDIESEEFNEKNMLVLAQQLINTPVSDALLALSSTYGNDMEDDEE